MSAILTEALPRQPVLLVGRACGTHLAGSLLHAMRKLKIEGVLVDSDAAFQGPRLQRRISWHLFGHRPARLAPFSRDVTVAARRAGSAVLLTTGHAPVCSEALGALSEKGVCL